MKKALLFVESNTTGTGMLAFDQAAELGVLPVLLTHDPKRYKGLEEHPCKVLVCDTNRIDRLIPEIDAAFPADQIGGITTTSEFYIPTAAALAVHYGRPGNPIKAMETCRNKALTRLRLDEARVGQPRFAILGNADEIPLALEVVGVPCVVKPVDDTGSFGVRLCRSAREAMEHARGILETAVNVRGQPTAGLVLVEEYLQAPEFSVEMFTWQGRTTCIGITEKHLTGSQSFVEQKHFFPAPLPADQAAQIEETVRRALQVVGVGCGATHTEVKLTPAGCKVVEINGRLAGGMIPELIRLATGIDPLQQHLKAALDQEPELTPSHRATAGIQFLTASGCGRLQEVRGVESAAAMPGVQQVTVTARPGTAVKPPESAYDRLGYVIAAGETYEETVQRLQEAVSRLEVVILPPEQEETA